MQATLISRETDPHDVFVIEPDVVLAARADQTSSTPPHDAIKDRLAALAEIASGVASTSPPVDISPSVDTTFRATDVNNIRHKPSSTGRLAKRVFMALFAISGAIAAGAWQHYGDAAKQAIAGFVPQFVLASSPSPEKADAAGQPGSAGEQASATDQAVAQPALPAQGAAADAAAPAPDPAQVQSMARDLAAMGQQIEQLKTRIDQLKAGQEQMSRDIAKNSEMGNSGTRTAAQAPRPLISAAPPRPPVAPVRKPRPAYAYSPAPAAPLPQAAAVPVPAPVPPTLQPPVQATVQPDGEPVVRPPMPVR
jgi:hypothetical protein